MIFCLYIYKGHVCKIYTCMYLYIGEVYVYAHGHIYMHVHTKYHGLYIYIYVDRYSYQDLCHLPFGPARSAAARRKSAHAKSTTLDALLPPGRLGLYRYIHKCVTERFIYSAISLSYRACLYVYIYMYIRCLTYTFICVRVYIH